MNFLTLVLFSILIKQGRSLLKCPAGSYSPTGDDKCYQCPKGEYQDETGQQDCKACELGEYNVELGQTTCNICPVGHSCRSRKESPEQCPIGWYQDKKGQQDCKCCKPGEYNVKTGQTTCNICPVGHSCQSRKESPEECGTGRYQDKKGQQHCKGCGPGEYNVKTGQTKCNICPVGHSCYSRHELPEECHAGEYQNKTGQMYCEGCKPGQYNLRTGAAECERCPAGSACPFRDTPPVPCSQGSYSPPESDICYPCPSGSFCPSPSSSPIEPSNDTVIRNEIHHVVKYAAEAYQDENDPPSRLIDSNNKVHGFVIYKGDAIVVAFRGTVGIKSWINNAKYLKTTYQSCKGCEIHKGFFETFNSVHMQMLARVNALSQAHPNSKLIVTGHSQGGALATLAAVELSNAGYNTDLITYGSPRVGNKKFSEYVDKTLKSINLRVTYKDDIVTVVPPQSIGYWHVGQEMHYTDQTTVYKLPPNTDVNYNRLNFGDHKLVNYEKLN